MAPTLKEKIIQVLIDKKLLKDGDLIKALEIQKEKGGSLSDILANLGIVSRNDIMIILSKELGVPPINISRYKINPSVLKIIPKKIVKHYHIIPISKMGEVLTVAMADPLNVFAMDDIKTLTGLKINPVITSDKDIREAIDLYYGEKFNAAVEKIVEDMTETSEIDLVEDDTSQSAVSAADLLRIVQEAPVVKITNMILADAITLRASDVLIEPLETDLRIRYRVDGMLQEGKRPPKTLHNAIVSRLKVMSSLDIAERRLPQDGRFKIRLHNREIDFRISILPSSKGEKVALRILDKSQAMLDLQKLGFDKKSLEDIRKAASRPHGMILVCGPTGCGKTTTLYSVLTEINSPEDNVVTVEDPVEYILDGLNQVSARPAIGLTFAAALRSILRQDPDIIMIGEIRDFETVDIAIKSALTGHLVLSTLHTTTATGSVVRLLNMGVEPFLMTSSILLVAAQRLVRKICLNCIEPVAIDKGVLDKLNIKLDPGQTFYKGRGCKVCLNTGYKGRLGLIEVLTMTPTIKNLILEGAQEHKLRDLARREGMRTLRENGIMHALESRTTLDEVLRVTAGEQDIPTV
jgi:type IV pilus assembly protein PilB